MFSTNTMVSYEEALAVAMRSSGAEGGGEPPGGRTAVAQATKSGGNTALRNTAAVVSATSIEPIVASSSANNSATGTFMNSTDILTQQRRTIKSSPPPPKRTSVQRPTFQSPTPAAAVSTEPRTSSAFDGATLDMPLAGAPHPSAAAPMHAHNELSTSTLSTVSDAGTAGSIGGGAPYKTHTVTAAAAHRDSDWQQHRDRVGPHAQAAHVEGPPPVVHTQHTVGGEASVSQHHALDRDVPTAIDEDPHADDVLLVLQSTQVLPQDSDGVWEGGSHQQKSGLSKRHRRDWAMATIGAWVDGLKWKAKWWSPFATVVRGQIQEAQSMLRDPTFDAIPSTSLRTQIHVWQAQLVQFLESPQTGAKWSHLIQHVYHRDAAVSIVNRSTRGSPRGASRSRSAAPTTAAPDVDSAAAPPSEGTEHATTASVLATPSTQQRSTPIKMLRRGDGLRGRGLDKVSAPSLHHTSTGAAASTSGDTVVGSGTSVTPQAVVPQRHAVTQGAPEPQGQPTGHVNQSSGPPANRTVYTVPTVAPEDRKTARSIAAFLAHVAGQHASPPRVGDTVPRITVSEQVLHQRRHQLLSTLFQSPDAASPQDASLHGMPSAVPRLDVRRHRDVFALRGDPHTAAGQRSVFAQFQGRPRLLHELIASTME